VLPDFEKICLTEFTDDSEKSSILNKPDDEEL